MFIFIVSTKKSCCEVSVQNMYEYIHSFCYGEQANLKKRFFVQRYPKMIFSYKSHCQSVINEIFNFRLTTVTGVVEENPTAYLNLVKKEDNLVYYTV